MFFNLEYSFMMFITVYFLLGISFIHVFFLIRERVCKPKDEGDDQNKDFEGRTAASVASTLQSPRSQQPNGLESINTDTPSKTNPNVRSLLKSASISASKCIGVKSKTDLEVTKIYFDIFCVRLEPYTSVMMDLFICHFYSF